VTIMKIESNGSDFDMLLNCTRHGTISIPPRRVAECQPNLEILLSSNRFWIQLW